MAVYSINEIMGVSPEAGPPASRDRVSIADVYREMPKPEVSRVNYLPTVGEPGAEEAAATVLSGIGSTIAGGYRGLSNFGLGLITGKGLDASIDQAADAVRKTQQGYTYQPMTETGQQALSDLQTGIEAVEDVVRYPVSGIVGAGDLAWGLFDDQDWQENVDQSVDTMMSARDDVSGTLGGRMLERTGNPEMATAAHLVPASIEALVGFKGLPRPGYEPSWVPQMQTLPKTVRQAAQGTAKQRMAQDIMEGATRNELAPYRVAPPPTRTASGQEAPRIAGLTALAERGGPRLESDPSARRAINQGMREGTVQAIKQASPMDRRKMLEMLDIKERALNDDTFALSDRPQQVVGNTILAPLRTLWEINKNAAAELDSVANSLKGSQVDYSGPVNRFLEELQSSMGIRFDNNLTPIYRGSDIEKLDGPQAIVNNIMERMTETDVTSAYDVHRLKKYIDENVTYGKAGEGLKGNTQRILKQLRHDLNELLQANYPEYARANQTYSDTIGVIDELQGFLPKAIDITGEYGDKAMGQIARKIGSNYGARVPLIQALDNIETIYRRYTSNPSVPRLEGEGLGSENYLAQLMFMNALDEMFGASGANTFQGQVDRGVRNAMGRVGEGVAGGAGIDPSAATQNAIGGLFQQGYDLLKGRNQENALKSVRDLLQSLD